MCVREKDRFYERNRKIMQERNVRERMVTRE